MNPTMFARLLPHVRSYRRKFLGNRNENLFMGSFPSFEAARDSAPVGKPVGYDNPDAAALPYSPQLQFYDYPALFWMGRSLDAGSVGVFDLGGHVGVKYYAYRRVLTYPRDLRWTVFDVPQVAQAGGLLAIERKVAAVLRFTTDMGEASGCDVFFASGSLQYLPQSLEDIIAGLASKPRRLILNTTAMHPTRTLYTLNSIGVAICPYRIVHQEDLMAQIARAGYRRRDAWRNEGKPIAVPFVEGGELAFYGGGCFDLVAAR